MYTEQRGACDIIDPQNGDVWVTSSFFVFLANCWLVSGLEFVRDVLGDAKQQNSLFWLALKLGWLNEVGVAAESVTKEKVYAFYHTTFEEYFAALAINDWHEFLNPTLDVYRIFAPQWKEVILLWLGREDVETEKKEEFIQALVEFDDGCGEFRVIDRVTRGFYEFRAYFLAAAGVDEWKNSSSADAIVAEIVKWDFGEFKVEQNDWVKFLYPILQEAQTALPQTNRIKAIAALVELIGKLQMDHSIRWQAAKSLEKILLEEQMPSVVTVLKNYLSPETYKNDFEQFDHCYQVIWKYAQSMPYPAFYQAWHQQEKVKDGELY
ncbi:hypothetical protein [Nostoc sp. NMS1]|uniref:hypothetical protein n=2 Tax=unclassified Nostoc TaxID=2593658 RepID=UPI0025EA03A4|nr:hypothetical protein [Nostoc sp. NMS1]